MKIFRVINRAKSYSVLPREVTTMELSIQREKRVDRLKVSNVDALNLLGKSFSSELMFCCDVHAADIFEAVAIANNDTEMFLDKLAFAVGAPVYEVQVIKGFDITPDVVDRQYVQFYYDILDKVGSKTIQIKNMDNIILGLLANYSERLHRAIHWYRNSLNEEEPLDRFSYIWIGLETLNSLFKDYYPNAIEVNRCKECGFERKIESIAALKTFFTQHLKNEKLFPDARRLREGLMHGFKEINSLKLKALELNEPLLEAFKQAICFLAGIMPEIASPFADLENSERITFLFRAKLHNLMVDDNAPEYEEPDFALTVKLEEHNNKLVFHPTVRTTIMNKRVSIGDLGWELGGNPGYPFELTQITLKA